MLEKRKQLLIIYRHAGHIKSCRPRVKGVVYKGKGTMKEDLLKASDEHLSMRNILCRVQTKVGGKQLCI